MTTLDLDCRDVKKQFNGHPAVNGLSFSIERGRFFSILGPSGCGKTTLLRLIAGFLPPDSGSIRIGGRDMAGLGPNQRPVTMVFQQLALFPMMNVGENVAYGLARRGVAKKERLHKAHDMLERVGLPNVAHKLVDQLSGGQRQRVAIARSLVLEPTLLLLDEPLGALDLKLREHMKVELKKLQAELGTTFVYITHDQSEALVLSDQVGVMNQGQFEQIGRPQELYYQPKTAFVAGFVGSNNRVKASVQAIDGPLVQCLTPEGFLFQSTSPDTLSLHATVDVFVRPEAIQLSAFNTSTAHTQAADMTYRAEVLSVLFDGANSSVLVKERQSGLELKVALPQTGAFADLRPKDAIGFAIDPKQTVCFKA
jgi:spermidine/putrescine transport system ATP-binding protein